MKQELEKIRVASEGLLFMSESDYPFEVVELDTKNASVEDAIRRLSGKEAGTPIENQAPDYFFRNHVVTYPGEPESRAQTAQRFIQLKELLNTTLTNLQVYRIGSIQVDAFIIGQLPDGSYAGLRTKQVET